MWIHMGTSEREPQSMPSLQSETRHRGEEKMSLAEMIELRSLVDVLYDVQDVRMRTDNRLRQMPRETAKLKAQSLKALEDQLTKEIDAVLQDIPIYKVFLGKVRGVGPRISGSIIAQTMVRFKRISEDEYVALESRYPNDTHIKDASHSVNDAHSGSASHPKLDTHLEGASHLEDDTHNDGASHKSDDTQVKTASHEPHDTQERGASLDDITFEQFHLAQKTDNGAYLIPVRRGIEAFDTCSKYWAWWGLHVVDGHSPKRTKGENIDWNPKMRTLAWKIGKQFIMQGQGYRQIYDREKDRLYEQRMPIGVCPNYEACKAKLKNRKEPACKGHIDAMAKRKAVKMFVSHLYECWRGLEGLPTRPPYVMEYLGHSTESTWRDLPDLEE